MVEIRWGQLADIRDCATLAVDLIGPRRGRSFLEAALDRRQLLVAQDNGRVVGFLAYRTDWFNCTFVSLVAVRPDYRRKGVARELYGAVETESPSARLFSSTEETNAASIRMHSALGFTPSGYIDNLPQGSRELLFYKRLGGGMAGEGGDHDHVQSRTTRRDPTRAPGVGGDRTGPVPSPEARTPEDLHHAVG